jgi:U3 small nucleolar RNA-associated protein 22
VLLLHLSPKALATALQQQGSAAAAATGFGQEGLVLRLLPAVGLDAFELSKLSPDRNNVRWVTGASSSSSKKAPEQQQQQQDVDLLPTPHYNAGILQDMLLLLGQQRLQAAAAAAGPRFADALLLLKIWAQQQGIAVHGVLPSNSSSRSAALATAAAAQADGFSGFLLAQLLLVALQQAGAGAAAAMSPLQQLRCALQLLVDKKAWSKAGLTVQRDSSVPAELRLLQQAEQKQQNAAAAAAVPGKVSKDHAKLQQKLQQQLQQLPAPAAAAAAAAARKAFDVVLLDSSGHLNLAANVSKSTLQMAQMAAARSLAILNRADLEPDAVFGAVFRPAQGLAGVFDYWWSVELPQQQQQQPGDQHPLRWVWLLAKDQSTLLPGRRDRASTFVLPDWCLRVAACGIHLQNMITVL